MKKFSPEFTAHIESGATTLCTCWQISRADGEVLGFTDHDEKLSFDGVEFSPAGGLEGSEVVAKLGAQVDTSEVTGILQSDAISENDIELGRYRSAIVKTIRVNWRDISVREILRVDTIGEITREDGIFRAELRSQLQALNVPQGRRYQSLCDVLVGAPRCGLDLGDVAYKGVGTITAIINRHMVEASGLSGFPDGWFANGEVRWTSGARQKLDDKVVEHVLNGALVRLKFLEPVGDWVSIGDQLDAYVGCDRRFLTCKEKFSNGENFQGFPHIPGNDFLLSYPSSKDDFSGKALLA